VVAAAVKIVHKRGLVDKEAVVLEQIILLVV
jgi:hypothetical protein